MPAAPVRDIWGKRAHAVRERAAVDAGRTVHALQQAASTFGEDRRAKLWPRRRSALRTEVGRWWELTYQAHLFTSSSPMLDAHRFERLTALLTDRGGAPHELALRLAAVLGRDAQHCAAAVNAAAVDVAETAMWGQLAELLPRGQRVSRPQAVWEQWYTRVYRATVAPHVLNQTSMPITNVEVRAVATALATDRPIRLYDQGRPLVFSHEGDFTHTARETWLGMLGRERREWLDSEADSTEGFEGRDFSELPRFLQVKLIRRFPPPLAEGELQAIEGRKSPVATAAAMFDAPPVEPLRPDQADWGQIEMRLIDQVELLVDQSWAWRAVDTADEYVRRAQTPDGLGANLSEAEVERAVELRREGRTHAEIAAELTGCTEETIGRALAKSGQLPGDSFNGSRGEQRWTELRVLAARACLDAEMSVTKVARMFDVGPANLRRHVGGPNRGRDLARASRELERVLAEQDERTAPAPPSAQPEEPRPGFDR